MWPPTRSTVDTRGLSSVGRALPLQGRCQEFESPRLHRISSAGLDRLNGDHAGYTYVPVVEARRHTVHEVHESHLRYRLVAGVLLLLLLLQCPLSLVGLVFHLVDDLPRRIPLPLALLIGARTRRGLLIGT